MSVHGRALAASFLALASCIVLAAGDVETQHRKVPADARSLTVYHARWNGNCQSLPPPRIELTTPPAHGKLDLAEGDFVVKVKRTGSVDCTGQTVRGVGLYYTPEPGYRGPDAVSYDNRSPGAPPLRFELKLTVE